LLKILATLKKYIHIDLGCGSSGRILIYQVRNSLSNNKNKCLVLCTKAIRKMSALGISETPHIIRPRVFMCKFT
jgi:hypothetical protein